ncbi:MAG TPA: UDP-N-acetylmuramate:L-alanyl-gamma-D-glutamyl-meso-diaminopimelate ligase [Pyrinomonadaceae bacterium]|jgi:UDP-N-acetylmuramate: L-alanyl-gamma-D-glutamyl-meso-diaminopimelate ligase|nr:UDP-N-acetylmuramate:L-alanyl-gamma-D-glutamyl-meso-diaminopimelate ligase [Pyrinomonadaceae bacterium]
MHYHLIGICGTAMAALAGMLQARGHQITGSDENVYPPMSTMLASLGIAVKPGYRAEHLEPAPDCVIVGNAIPRGNAEVEATLNRKLLYRSQAEVVKEEFIRGRRSLVVAGTHGKTTTTSIAAWVMDQGGLDPTFLIGGVAQNFGVSFRVTGSDYFIIEGDEYDTAYFDKGPKFMHYLPEIAIVNNIEFDHADIYQDLAAVKLAFRRFMNLVPANGKLIAGWDSQHVREVIASMGQRLFTRLETFGTSEEAKWRLTEVDFSGELSRFTVTREGEQWGKFETPLIGDFNLLNCLAVIIAAGTWGINREAIAGALRSFKNVRRRAEVRGEEGGVLVIDDFAHHPTAVRETLRGLRNRYQQRRLIAVFEPRSWSSRLAVFQDEYATAFAAADYVVIASVFDSQKVLEKGKSLDTDKLIRDISRDKPAIAIPGADEIITHLLPQLRKGDVVAIMSNGAFGGIHDKLLEKLRHKEQTVDNSRQWVSDNG